MIPHVRWGGHAARLIATHFGVQVIVRGIGGLGSRFILVDSRVRTRTCLVHTAVFGAVDLFFEASDLGWRMACHYADPLAIRKPPWTERHDEDVTEGWCAALGTEQPGLKAVSRAFEALANERRAAA